jgi:hypothetical protein
LNLLRRLTIFIVAFTVSLSAQISIDTVTTDTIDLFADVKSSSTPSRGAIWSSLAFPGSGHQIIGNRNRALGLLSFDMISLFGAVFFNQFSRKTVQNYKAYASFHAGISGSHSNDYYWQVVGNFDNYHDYHETMKLIRNFDNRFTDEKYYWQWEDESFREEYIKMQKTSKKMKTISSLFVGAMLLNRIVAFIDIRSAFKNERFSLSSFSVDPLSTSSSTAGIQISTQF